ncbi:uncharacterized protein LOC143488678 [Brachyhypopomus gauderio]|uniref:uncharacterized protein LOC143488678 n=1 Tax=Brachyhypopomus gauderio TaxID=698409 RepID=UPI00404370F3
MASDAQACHRTFLLCTLCKKTHWSLSVHLRRNCMKNASETDFARAVETAKTEANNLLRNGRVWDYDLIKRIVSSPTPVDGLIEELQVRGNVVLNIPPIPDPTPAIPDLPSAADPVAGASDTASSSSSGELYQCPADVNQGTSLRERMSAAGLYKKHSNDHPLLCAFATYLRKELGNVDNVARFLFFMDHREPNLFFVRQPEKTRQYLSDLAGAGLTKQTVQNYVKSIKR